MLWKTQFDDDMYVVKEVQYMQDKNNTLKTFS